MNLLYSELRWLLPTPKDFSEPLSELDGWSSPLGPEFQLLARYGSSLNQFAKLAPRKIISTGFAIPSAVMAI